MTRIEIIIHLIVIILDIMFFIITCFSKNERYTELELKITRVLTVIIYIYVSGFWGLLYNEIIDYVIVSLFTMPVLGYVVSRFERK